MNCAVTHRGMRISLYYSPESSLLCRRQDAHQQTAETTTALKSSAPLLFLLYTQGMSKQPQPLSTQATSSIRPTSFNRLIALSPSVRGIVVSVSQTGLTDSLPVSDNDQNGRESVPSFFDTFSGIAVPADPSLWCNQAAGPDVSSWTCRLKSD